MMKDLEGGLCCRSVMSPAACRTKRVLDVMASVIGMAIFSPLFLIIYAAIKWEDGGKAIFRQERVGYHGETFTLYKFRSMIASSESDGRPALCSGADDRRLTRVGRCTSWRCGTTTSPASASGSSTIWTSSRSCGTCSRAR